MRKNVLPITAGVLGALVISVSAPADFTGWSVENKGQYNTADSNFGEDVGLVDIWNLYLNFDNDLDTVNSIFVIQDEMFNTMINNSLAADGKSPGGGFWNNVNEGNTPEGDGFIYSLDPTGFDNTTFITIGLKAGHFGDSAFFSTGAEKLLNASGIMNGTGVLSDPDTNFSYSATPKDGQTFPDELGRVLVFQVAVLKGEHASGEWNIQWGTVDPNGGGGIQERISWTTVPAPGAMALLGLAGLAGARRRRRR